MMGARLFHDGPASGLPRVTERARTALLRALATDMSNATAGRLLVQLAGRGDTAFVVDSIALAAALSDSVSPFAPFVRWRIAAVKKDSVALRDMRTHFERYSSGNLRLIAMASQFDAVALD